MGNKRDSVRTTPDGRRVVHHPDGEQDLVQNGRMVKRLASSEESTAAKVAALREAALRATERKRESLAAGDSVPSDKRPI
jgi:predicted GIY-YIG superfamily endonuclease